MSGSKKALLFDIDGTLIITDGAGTISWSFAFKELYQLDVDIEKYSDTGMTDPEVGRRSFTAVIGRPPTTEEFSKLLERRMHYLVQTVNESTGYHVLPGVQTLLPSLIEHGFILGLVTGNLEAAAHVKLHRSNLNQYFSFGGYGSDSPERSVLTKIAMARGETVYGEKISPDAFLAIGDTPNDIIAAHQAGIQCVGVASHKYTASDLKDANADFVLNSLEEALPVW